MPLSRGTDPGEHTEDGDALDQQAISELVREFRNLRRTVQGKLDRNQPRGQTESARPSQGTDRAHRQPSAEVETGIQQSLSEVQEELAELSTEVAEIETRHDATLVYLEADIDEALQTLDDLESEVEDLVTRAELASLAGSFHDELSAVQETTDELGDRVAHVADSQADLRAEVSALGNDHGELVESIEQDFDGIEDLFRHLLTRTDDIEDRIDTVADSRGDSLEAIEQYIQERDRFAALMREANQKGVSTAVCENCDTRVDLRLLESTRCPECDHTFSGVRTGGWTPFTSATIETERHSLIQPSKFSELL